MAVIGWNSGPVIQSEASFYIRSGLELKMATNGRIGIRSTFTPTASMGCVLVNITSAGCQLNYALVDSS